MSAVVERAFTAAREAVAAARAAPLSRKKAMLAVLLIDQAADARFAASGEGDILAFRAELAAESEALALVLALAAMGADGPQLVVEAVAVPLAEYPMLGVEDFMVSLYNGQSVQRVLVATPDGARRDVHEMLVAALSTLAQV